jgi:nitrogen-specific signal transduction histidine kinase
VSTHAFAYQPLGPQAMLTQHALERLQSENTTLLNTLDEAAITVDANHCAASMNKRAETLVLSGNYFCLVHQTLTAKGPSTAQFSSLLTRVGDSGVPESMSIVTLKPTYRVHVTVSCASKTTLLVLITQPNHRRVATVQQLMQLFKLSPAEARLARASARTVDAKLTSAMRTTARPTTPSTSSTTLHQSPQPF